MIGAYYGPKNKNEINIDKPLGMVNTPKKLIEFNQLILNESEVCWIDISLLQCKIKNYHIIIV